ncbi:MAG: mechanosensitive ion channel [Bacteroidota bacterium]|nr:mechanosensitive ion channel [Bacteroidota bacterium]
MVDIEQILLLGLIILRLVVVLLFTIGALSISRFILKRWLWPAIKTLKSSDKIFRLVENALLDFILLMGLQAAVGLFSKYFSGYAWLINNFFFVLYVSVVTYVVLNMISIVSDWYLSRVSLKDQYEIERRGTRYVQYISQLVFGFLAITIILEHFKVTQVSFRESFTALGIGGIVIGLAAQSTLADLIAGIAISIDRPFKIGDRIFIEKLSTWGDVIEMSWRSTRILTRDNREVAIPNSVIGKELITNYSMPNRMFRVETLVVVSYGPDIEYVRSLILESLAHEAWIMHDKPLQALISNFTEFGVEFKVRCWIENFVDTRISEDRLNTAIYKALINGNIAMPCSNVMIHVADQDNESIFSR